MPSKTLRTRWKPHQTLDVGKAVLQMVKAYASELAPRGLDAAFIAAFEKAIADYEEGLTGGASRRNTQVSKTRNQADLVGEARARVMAIRGALQDVHRSNKAVLVAYGVGNPKTVNSLRSALEAVDAIMRGHAQQPAAATSALVVQADLDDLAKLREALIASESDQESAKGDRKLGTHAVASLGRAVEAHIDRAFAAARLTFATRPDVLAKFTGSVPTSSRKKVSPVTPDVNG